MTWRRRRAPPTSMPCRPTAQAELIELHETLNPVPGSEAFEPHITLGLFGHAAEAEQLARIVERQHLPMHGRVEELALLQRATTTGWKPWRACAS